MEHTIGDYVCIKDAGETYARYAAFIDDNLPEYMSKWKYGGDPHKGETVKILFAGMHPKYNCPIYIVEGMSGQVYIVDELGLGKLEHFSPDVYYDMIFKEAL